MQKAEYIARAQFSTMPGRVEYPDMKSNIMSEFDQIAPRFQNWRITVAYDGTGFSGWQVQPGECTIQGEIQSALG